MRAERFGMSGAVQGLCGFFRTYADYSAHPPLLSRAGLKPLAPPNRMGRPYEPGRNAATSEVEL
jgi:hypothetical protein